MGILSFGDQAIVVDDVLNAAAINPVQPHGNSLVDVEIATSCVNSVRTRAGVISKVRETSEPGRLVILHPLPYAIARMKPLVLHAIVHYLSLIEECRSSVPVPHNIILRGVLGCQTVREHIVSVHDNAILNRIVRIFYEDIVSSVTGQPDFPV